jgi:hypothetical protein
MLCPEEVVMSSSMRLHVEKLEGNRWVAVPSPFGPPRRNGPPTDWYSSAGRRDYDTIAILTNVGNADGFQPVDALIGLPADLSETVTKALPWLAEDSTVRRLLLSQLKAYDWEQDVTKVARTFSPDELKERGWLGDGTERPYIDIQSHRWELWQQRGYQEIALPVKDLAGDLFELIAKIEEITATEPTKIRLIFWCD